MTAQALMNKGNIQPFLAKLYCMVNDPETDRLIAWAPNGASFYGKDEGCVEAHTAYPIPFLVTLNPIPPSPFDTINGMNSLSIG